jgi:hypothetical protein
MKNRRIKGHWKLWRKEKLKGTESYVEQKNKRAGRAMKNRRIKGQGKLWRTERKKGQDSYEEQEDKRALRAMIQWKSMLEYVCLALFSKQLPNLALIWD